MKSSYMFISDARADDGSVMDWRLLLAQLAQAGLQGIDIYPSYLQRAGIALSDALAAFADNSLVPAQYAAFTDFITPGADVQHSLDLVKAGVDVCVKHGISQLFSAGGQHSNSGPEAMSRYVDGLQKALEIATAAGIGFSIENAGRMCHTWESLLECVTRVGPEMLVTLDGGNFVLAGSDPHVAAEKLGPRVVHVHLKNVVPAPGREPYPFEYCPPAEGLVDYGKVISTLAGYGFDGHVSFEPDGWPKVRPVDGVRYCRGLADRFSRSQS